MTKYDYSDEHFIKNCWPEWKRAGDGYLRVWRFEFERELDADRISNDGLGDEDLQVAVQLGESSSVLIAETWTVENPFSDSIFFVAFWRLFQRIEARFGRLKTIQGQARESWRPFR